MSVAVKPITDKTDERIACYNRKNYDFRSLKARSMAWFVQVAIRRDMDVCLNGDLDWDNPFIQLQGHREIFDKLDALETLIRKRHIIDEDDLASIGLTLYNFSTLSHFFVAPEKQAFVREVTVGEIVKEADYLKRIVLDGRLAAYVAQPNSGEEYSERDIIGFVNQMTPTTLEREAGVVQDETRKERLLLVDMNAPVAVLKRHFLKLLDRQSRLKQAAYDDWEEYGILPYLDMLRWMARNHSKIKASTRAEMIYDNSKGFGSEKFKETTIPHIEKLMDHKGPVFRSLLAEASDEFRDSIAWTRREDPDANPTMGEEMLKRWLPKSYPYNFPDLERTARTFPKFREASESNIEFLKIEAEEHSITERIRKMNQKEDGTGQLRVREKQLDRTAYACPVTDSDDPYFDPACHPRQPLNLDDLMEDAEWLVMSGDRMQGQ